MKELRKLTLCLIIMMIFTSISALAVTGEIEGLSQSQIDKINKIVNKNMGDGKIPGVSLTIVEGDKIIYKKGFGYADKKNKNSVTPDTFFQLGSNSKAYTGLAILKLEKEGLVNLKDPIDKYIPWFNMMFNGEKISITVEQAMNHTSGIPFNSIENIPESDSDSSLEDAVYTLVGKSLQSKPGENFNYATINYDILGLIIEKVTNQSYETYVKEKIINEMGLKNTYMFEKDIALEFMAKGYKIGFLKALQYDAPIYRGNKPAGYILSNGNDMAKWMQVQLGVNNESKIDKDLIKKSHSINNGEAINNGGLYYTVGWFINKSTNEVSHGGNNPNFSSNIILDTDKCIGITVLANLNSSFTSQIADEVMSLLQNKEVNTKTSDMYIQADKIAVAAICISSIVILVMIFFITRFILQCHSKKRKYIPVSKKGMVGICISFVFMIMLGVLVYKSPEIFLDGVTWKSMEVWAPKTVVYGVFEAGIASVVLYSYLVLDMIFKQEGSKSYFSIAVISIISGLGNALVIFMINEALSKGMAFHLDLLLYFIFGILTYVFGQRVVRAKLIHITNEVVYKLRVELFNKILNTSYENIEKLENGKIEAIINNDTETVATFANHIISASTSAITLICCFIYLGFINVYALLLSIFIILIIASIYYFAGQSANRLWEETRDTQNVFFKFINDMNKGIKELHLSINKRDAFKEDMKQLSYIYSEKRGKASLTFANVFVIGELVFTLAIGTVVFFFPIVFKGIQSNDLRSYVFVLLYMTGPVNGLLNVIPNLIQIKVSWNRVNEFIKEISQLSEKDDYTEEKYEEINKVNLKLKNIEYEYVIENAEKFKVGPISYEFNSGEIIFITGGNGSGKSTLGKLLTGLYNPQNGEIRLNNKIISTESLGQKYSAIFGDFHLFDKLYGIDYEEKLDEFEKYLNMMRINDKIQVEDGSFNTTKLSTGQRKRLALAISYLEDRPIYLFDEWAADQDPEFREFFYKKLLPQLRKRGKCVIAITHDDRYFNLADKVIKMEFGKIVDENYKQIAATIEE